MRTFRPTPIIALVAGLSVAALTGCEGGHRGPDVTMVQALLDSARARAEAPGAILGIAMGDQAPLVVTSGVADLESGRAMEAGDPHHLGSVSKIYTAVVVLRLVEEGIVSLSDPLSRYLPEFPRADEITLHHLLAHTSGLKDFYSYLYFRPNRDEMIDLVTRSWTEEELLELAARFGHWFDPGTDWSYSNAGYYLLAVVIERITGQSLPEAYRDFIYGPLSLEATWLTVHESGPDIGLPITGYMGPVEAWSHSDMFGELGPTTILDRSPVEFGAGGMAAPSHEAIRFLRALVAGGLLRGSSLATLMDFRPVESLGIIDAAPPTPDNPDGYGLGMVRMVRDGLEVVGHGGLFTGHTAGLWYVPACDLTISVFFNRGFVGHRRLLDEVIDLARSSDWGRCQEREGHRPPRRTVAS